jgi:hypothetical protein
MNGYVKPPERGPSMRMNVAGRHEFSERRLTRYYCGRDAHYWAPRSHPVSGSMMTIQWTIRVLSDDATTDAMLMIVPLPRATNAIR